MGSLKNICIPGSYYTTAHLYHTTPHHTTPHHTTPASQGFRFLAHIGPPPMYSCMAPVAPHPHPPEIQVGVVIEVLAGIVEEREGVQVGVGMAMTPSTSKAS